MNNITVAKECGLCNRVKTYMSCLTEYDSVSTQVYADSYIFPSVKYKENPEKRLSGWRLKVLPEEEKYIENYKTIDFLYEKTPEYFIEKYTGVLKKIEINREILDYANSFLEDWSEVIGVHVRSWWTDGNRSKWHDINFFEKEIDKFDSTKKIFLCSDNDQVIKYFVDKYGERIILHDQKIHKRKYNSLETYHENVQLIADAFIDCLLLSKCNTIIGTWGSTFTEVAWWLGGCNSKVIVTKSSKVSIEEEKSFIVPK
jgi:hypothetical protein